MKILAIVPSDMTVEGTLAGLQSLLGHDVSVYRFDKHGVPVDRGMIDVASWHRPDLLVYIGQNGGPFLAAETTFHHLKTICPTVLLCFDASDKTWFPLLTNYRDHDTFSLIVSIDGNPAWPKREIDYATLTPIAVEFYV